MNADRGIDAIVLPAQVDCPFEDSAVWVACADVEDRCDACGSGALEHRLAIAVKLRSINVCMRVDEHCCCPADPCNPCSSVAYFKRAPLGTSSVNVAITGRPSSPYDAATTMPCDS